SRRFLFDVMKHRHAWRRGAFALAAHSAVGQADRRSAPTTQRKLHKIHGQSTRIQSPAGPFVPGPLAQFSERNTGTILVDAKAVTYRAPVCAFPNDGLLRDVNTRSTF